jgi:hypothetical protein
MTGAPAPSVRVDICLHGNPPHVDAPFEPAYVNRRAGFSASTTHDRMTDDLSDAFTLAQTSVAILAIGTLMIL